MPPEPTGTVTTDNTIDWQAVADELAGALRTTMLRNPILAARDWDRASAALERYDGATCGLAVEFRKPPGL
jgi:2-keto-3-deoxy-6-phosphogluconate aldolase